MSQKFQKSSKKVPKKLQKSSKKVQKKLQKSSKKVQKKFKKFSKKFQKSSKLSKNCQVMSPHHSDQMSQRSLISSLESRVALCMSKVKVPSVSESVSQSVTRSPIELFWTAKNNNNNNNNNSNNDNNNTKNNNQGCGWSSLEADWVRGWGPALLFHWAGVGRPIIFPSSVFNQCHFHTWYLLQAPEAVPDVKLPRLNTNKKCKFAIF